jgi:ATP-dependent Lon protease
MATALYSAYTGKTVPDALAMTGELTLSGLVLPVGGIKEKLLAAHRSGMRHVIVPKDNEADLVKLPQTVRDDIKLTLVSHLDEVFSAVFG